MAGVVVGEGGRGRALRDLLEVAGGIVLVGLRASRSQRDAGKDRRVAGPRRWDELVGVGVDRAGVGLGQAVADPVISPGAGSPGAVPLGEEVLVILITVGPVVGGAQGVRDRGDVADLVRGVGPAQQ